MIPSPGNRRLGHDAVNGRGSRRRRLLLGMGLVLLAVLLALAFVGYRQPELLLDYVNLRYCG